MLEVIILGAFIFGAIYLIANKYSGQGGIRRVVYEYEADLKTPNRHDLSAKQGELEIKKYADGTYRIKIELKNINHLPDGSSLSFQYRGREIAKVQVKAGRVYELLTPVLPANFMEPESGELIKVMSGPMFAFSGVLRRD